MDNSENLLALVKEGETRPLQFKHNDVDVLVIPNDMKVHTLESLAEAFREKPVRLRHTMRVHSVESFIEYFNRYANENSTVAIDIEGKKIVGVIDYHHDTGATIAKEQPAQVGQLSPEPRHCEHRVEYAFPVTPEYTAWRECDNFKMTQIDFAHFIEEHSGEIIEPNAAEMLQVALTLKSTKTVNFRQGTRLDNGQVQFLYEETIEGRAGETGQFAIHEVFKIQVQAFRFGAAYNITARLRHRTTKDGLIMWYTLINPQRTFDDAVLDVQKLVKDNVATPHVYAGTL